MNLNRQPYSDETDKQRMLALVHADPGQHLHVIDLPYRLSSWAFDHPENIALWTDRQERLMAWAVLQPPFWTIDYAYHPTLSVLGEGDGTLRYWRDVHWQYFSRECQRIGREPSMRMPVVCEQFRVVFPTIDNR